MATNKLHPALSTKALSFSAIMILLSYISYGQNVKIGATNAAPNASAMLDIDGVTGVAGNPMGILIPRMTYAQRTGITTLSAAAQGLLVYQTDVNGTSAQGFYYNTSTTTAPNWVYLDGTAWDIAGNSNVTAANNFIGTTVAQDFLMKTGGSAATNERMRVAAGGNVIVNNTGIGTNTNDVFSVYANGTTNGNAGNTNISSVGANAINGYTSGTGYGVYGANTGTGAGVGGYSSGAGGVATYGQADGNNGFGVLAIADATTGSGIGVYGESDGDNGLGVEGLSLTTSTTGVPAGVYGQANTSTGFGVAGANATATGTGVGGIGGGVGTFETLIEGSGGAFTGSEVGVYGYATSYSSGAISAGGYFVYNGGTSFCYVGAKNATGVIRKIEGNGTMNTVVNDIHGNKVVLSAPEAPENLFMDFGQATLSNGAAHISLDSTFALNIVVADNHPLRVVLTPEGNCNQLYYFNSNNNGFDVLESNGGTSNVTFTWMVVANRADEVLSNGTISKYSSERFGPSMGFQPTTSVKIPTVTPKPSFSK